MTISVVFTIGLFQLLLYFSILFSGFGVLIRNIKRRRSVLEIQSPNGVEGINIRHGCAFRKSHVVDGNRLK